jgi:beta-mannanase
MNPSRIPPELPDSRRFDYSTLDPETRVFVQQRTSEIKQRLRAAARTIWEIGQNLVEVRDRLEFGQFHDWLRGEFQWSRSTAYNYINVFISFGSCPKFGQLPNVLKTFM